MYLATTPTLVGNLVGSFVDGSAGFPSTDTKENSCPFLAPIGDYSYLHIQQRTGYG
jgi:hypothetical protein